MLNLESLLGPQYWSWGHGFYDFESSVYIHALMHIFSLSGPLDLEKKIFKTHTMFSLLQNYLLFEKRLAL